MQAARRLVFSAAAAHAVPRPHRGKRKAPATGSPSPGPEAPRPAKRAKTAGRGANSGSDGTRPSAPAGGGGGSAAPEANAAARGGAGLGPGLAPGSGEAAAEGDKAGDVEPQLGREGGDRHAPQEQPDDADGGAQPGKAAGGVKRRRREADAGVGQEPAAFMCGPAFPCTGLAATRAKCLILLISSSVLGCVGRLSLSMCIAAIRKATMLAMLVSYCRGGSAMSWHVHTFALDYVQMRSGCRVTPEGWRLERRMQPSGQSPMIYIPPGSSRQLRSRKQVRQRTTVAE